MGKRKVLRSRGPANSGGGGGGVASMSDFKDATPIATTATAAGAAKRGGSMMDDVTDVKSSGRVTAVVASGAAAAAAAIAAPIVRSATKQKRIDKMAEKKQLKTKLSQLKHQRRKLGSKSKIENDGVRKELTAALKTVKQTIADAAAADAAEKESYTHMQQLFTASANAATAIGRPNDAMHVMATVDAAAAADAMSDSKSAPGAAGGGGGSRARSKSRSARGADPAGAPLAPYKFAPQPSKNDKRRAKSASKIARALTAGKTVTQTQQIIANAVPNAFVAGARAAAQVAAARTGRSRVPQSIASPAGKMTAAAAATGMRA